MARSKFHELKLQEMFFIKDVLCRKTSPLTYVVTGTDEFIGEISYDPIIDPNVQLVSERNPAAPDAAVVKTLRTRKTPERKATKKATRAIRKVSKVSK